MATVKVLDFFAVWCPPCQQMTPIIEKLEKELSGRVSFEKVNVDEESERAARYGVLSVPTFVIEKDGQEVARRMGAGGEEVFRRWIEAYL